MILRAVNMTVTGREEEALECRQKVEGLLQGQKVGVLLN